jgi:large subunit ribosomal protein L29
MRSTKEFLKNINEKSVDELVKLLREKKLHLFELKLKFKTQQLTNPNEIRHIRRDISRVLTLMKKKEVSNA